MDELEAFLSPLVVTEDTLYNLACKFSKTYRYLALNSTEQFLSTPLSSLPSGRERGKFLAIDFGGSNLRVGLIELYGQITKPNQEKIVAPLNALPPDSRDVSSIRRSFEKAWSIGEHLKNDKAEDLFDWIGDCIAEVVRNIVTSGIENGKAVPKELAMGVTFSFPMMQDSLAEATIMPMGKGFAIKSNLDLGKRLLAGYERHITDSVIEHYAPTDGLGAFKSWRTPKNLPRLKIFAITNDTVATLASLAYIVNGLPHSKVAMAVIVGTGTNAAIPMRVDDLHSSKRASTKSSNTSPATDMKVIVNTEWGIKGTVPPLNELRIVTKWDKILDEAHEAPGFQPFEHMTSGRYLGELVRLITREFFTARLDIRLEDLPSQFRSRNALTATFLTRVIGKAKQGSPLLPQLEQGLPPPSNSPWCWTRDTSEIIRRVADLVQIRAASLIAASIMGLLDCTGDVQLEVKNESRRSVVNGAVLRPSADAPQGNQHVEELVIAYTGGTITQYPGYLETCQNSLDKIQRRQCHGLPSKSVILREAADGGIIGAGVLAGSISRPE
ncbi:MAG: hypothetical protein M1827_002348 [Pycnora praestabilis]|nr:MAG: hypothetical protein M1827_002348 [Pycnora praestabilis]